MSRDIDRPGTEDVSVPSQREAGTAPGDTSRTRADRGPEAGGEPPAAESSRRRTGRWRPWVAGALLTIAALLAPLCIVATWAHDQITDTDRYVSNVAPLSSDPDVQKAVANRLTTELFARLDVAAITQETLAALKQRDLPPRVEQNLDALAIPIADGVRSFLTDRVTRIVESPTFDQAWTAANRVAHAQLVAVLTGEGRGAVEIAGNTVTLNLGPLIEQVKARLTEDGFGLADRIPAIDAQFTLVQSDDLGKARDSVDLLEGVSRVLPVVALLLLAVGVYVARDRRRALLHAGLAVAASMLVLGAALNVFRSIYLDAFPSTQVQQDAAASIYDTLVRFIRFNLRAVLVVALAVAFGAWVTGPSAAAAAVRRGFAATVSRVRGDRGGAEPGPVGAFVYTYLTALRASVIGLAVLVYVLAAHPTGAWTLKVLAVLLVALFVLQVLARPPLQEPSDAPDSPATPVPPSPA